MTPNQRRALFVPLPPLHGWLDDMPADGLSADVLANEDFAQRFRESALWRGAVPGCDLGSWVPACRGSD